MVQPTDSLPPALVEVLHDGQAVGPYVVAGLLGKGGMGEVYRAHDSRLDRHAAIKVLRAGGAPQSTLVGEAQAMAKLSHPNVVTVYEVGTAAERVYVAMELIEGHTLRAWLAAAPRTWREVVTTFVDAGRGLAAAHAAGVLHRDFKPDNVLVGHDGRVRVSDFGLAGAALAAGSDSPEALASGDTLGFTLALAGTPAYMSPEQHARDDVDARSDQFAFCVALFEALYGRRPFNGATVGEIRDNVAAGRVVEIDGRKVPGWVQAIVLRGLSAARADRYPSMDALLADLTHDPNAGRRRLAMVAALVATSGLAVFGLTRHPAVARVCDGGEDRLARAWGPAQRATVERAFAQSTRPYQAAVFTRLAAALDEYAGAWSALHREACRASAATVLDAQMGCLERRAAELGALVGLLSHDVDGDLVDRSVSAVRSLSQVGGCANVTALLAPVPPPDNPATQLVVAALRARLDVARADQLAGRIKPGIAVAVNAAAEARGLGYAPLTGEALLLAAELQDRGGDWKKIEATTRDALAAASAGHDDLTAAQALVKLALVVGDRQGKSVEGLALVEAARAAVARAGDPPALRARLGVVTAGVYETKHDYPRALEELQRAMAIEEQFGIEENTRAATLNALGNLYKSQNRLAEARATFQRVLELWEKNLGKDHAYVGVALANLASLERRAGEFTHGEEHLRRALQIWEAAVGPEHRIVARLRSNLARILDAEGRSAEAHAENARVLAMQEKSLGANDPDLAQTVENDAAVYENEDRFEDARRLYQRELEMREQSQGRDHRDTVQTHALLASAAIGARDLGRARAELELARTGLGATEDAELGAMIAYQQARIELHDGRPEQALARAREAQAGLEKSLGADTPERAEALDLAGLALDAAGRPAEALVEHQAAVAMIERSCDMGHPLLLVPLTDLAATLLALHRTGEARAAIDRLATLRPAGASPHDRAHAEAVEARVRWEAGGDQAAAAALARKARGELAALGKSGAAEVAEIDAWLRGHPTP